MKKFIISLILLLSFPASSLAGEKIITVEPEQSPPINAGDRYIRMEAYSTQTVYVKGGIMVSIKEALTPESTYLTDYSGTSRSLLIEINCQTGQGFLVGISQNSAIMPVKPQPINLSQNLYAPHTIAVSLACKHFRQS